MLNMMHKVEAAVARAGAAAMLYTLAGIVLLASAGFALAAFYIWVDTLTWHPASPGLWTALLLLILALIVMLAGKLVLRGLQPGSSGHRHQSSSATGSAAAGAPPGASELAAMSGLASELIRRNPAGGIAAAGLAGVAIGASPEIRRMLADMARAALSPKPPAPPPGS